MEKLLVIGIVLLSITCLIRLLFKMFKGQCVCCNCDKEGDKKKICSCKE
ncbi:hypothetical protein MASR1M68_02910 [Elusimicrobiota bacterium]